MPRTNKTKYALLGMLRHGPMSGYDIKKISDSSLSYFWSENYGHIYPILKRLRAEGLARSVVRQTAGRPDRHVYAITPKGKKVFLEWLRMPAEAEIRRNEFLLKLFFSGGLPLRDLVQLIEYEKNRYAHTMEKFQQIGRTDTKKTGQKGGLRGDLLTLNYGQKITSARIAWCEEISRKLKTAGI